MVAPKTPPSARKKRKIPAHRRLGHWYRKQRPLNKLAIWMLVASFPVGFLGLKLVRPAYRQWKQQNALILAASCIQKKDDKGAMLAFRRAILADPRSPKVWIQLGAYLENKNSPEALWVWDHLAQLQPGIAEHRYRVARVALAGGDWRRARNNLDAVLTADRQSRAYLLLSARTLGAAGERGKAEAVLRTLLARAPKDEEVAFRLDELLSNSADPATQQDAENRMRSRASVEGPQMTAAMRQLAFSEARAGNIQMANFDAGLLAGRHDANLTDQLLFLETEFLARSFSLPLSVRRIRELALANPDNLRPIMTYLIRRGRASETQTWLESLPPEKLSSPDMIQVRLDLAIGARDWEKVYVLLAKIEPPVSADLRNRIRDARNAFRADQSGALIQWDEVLRASKANFLLLATLEQLTLAWEWTAGREKVLWTISEVLPGNPLVLRELLPIALRNGDSPALLQILSGLVVADPSNRDARSMWLAVQFLLHRGDPKEMLRLAQADAKSSNTPESLSIDAALLVEANKVDEALVAAAKIPPEAQASPRPAAYLSYVYAKARKPALARALLVHVDRSNGELLPEELALTDRARAILDGRAEDKLPIRDAKLNEATARQILRRLEGEQGDSVADRQRLLQQLKSQSQNGKGANEQLQRLREETQGAVRASPPPAK